MERNIMKAYLHIVAVTLAVFVAVPASAQLHFGLKGGINVVDFSFSSFDNFKNSISNADNRSGFFVGPTVEFTLPVAGLGVDLSALYDQRTARITDAYGSEEKKLHYVEIPLNLKYTIGLGSLAAVFATTGPQFMFNVTDMDLFDKLKSGEYRSDFELRKSEFSWNVGGGVKLFRHIQVAYNYNMPLGNTSDASWRGSVQKLADNKSEDNTHQVSLTYIF